MLLCGIGFVSVGATQLPKMAIIFINQLMKERLGKLSKMVCPIQKIPVELAWQSVPQNQIFYMRMLITIRPNVKEMMENSTPMAAQKNWLFWEQKYIKVLIKANLGLK